MSDLLYPIPYAMLTSYCLSGSLMEHFALFPGWLALSLSHPTTSTPSTSVPKNAPVITVHIAQSPGLAYIYALPKVALTCAIIAQLFHSPGSRTNWWSFLMLSVSWASSVLVQIPLQQRIRKTGDAEAVKRLVLTDWMRVLTMAGHFVGVVLAVAA
jgi:hypothetical protein